MVDRDVLWAWRSAAWIPVTALCWLYAAYGYSTYPRFDMWFWGISFVIDLVVVVVALVVLALR